MGWSRSILGALGIVGIGLALKNVARGSNPSRSNSEAPPQEAALGERERHIALLKNGMEPKPQSLEPFSDTRERYRAMMINLGIPSEPATPEISTAERERCREMLRGRKTMSHGSLGASVSAPRYAGPAAQKASLPRPLARTQSVKCGARRDPQRGPNPKTQPFHRLR